MTAHTPELPLLGPRFGIPSPPRYRDGARRQAPSTTSLVGDNPARRVENATSAPTHALVWTDGRVQQWRDGADRPSVAVWTTTQLTTFLDSVADDPLYALWWLISLRGVRRGEAAGLLGTTSTWTGANYPS